SKGIPVFVTSKRRKYSDLSIKTCAHERQKWRVKLIPAAVLPSVPPVGSFLGSLGPRENETRRATSTAYDGDDGDDGFVVEPGLCPSAPAEDQPAIVLIVSRHERQKAERERRPREGV
ncbi:hypothetical protein K0M31_007565, partial [Melipona bicolor]